jgi:hypothetical protein
MKKEKWDGRSRPTNDLYKKEFDRIFGKKEKTTSELLMEGYEEEKKNVRGRRWVYPRN